MFREQLVQAAEVSPENEENAENIEIPSVAQNASAESNDEDMSDMWEETFKSHTDSKPNGFNAKFSVISLFKHFKLL